MRASGITGRGLDILTRYMKVYIVRKRYSVFNWKCLFIHEPNNVKKSSSKFHPLMLFMFGYTGNKHQNGSEVSWKNEIKRNEEARKIWIKKRSKTKVKKIMI